jgi:hypothetical protein
MNESIESAHGFLDRRCRIKAVYLVEIDMIDLQPLQPWHFSKDEPDPLRQPAFRGEHNAELFAELGYSEAEILDYSERSVLVGHARA